MRPIFSKIAILLVLVFGISFGGNQSYAQSSTAGKEFVMSCTYGVLAGTLVGFASLAFTDQPGENLSRVARGASLGLYLGIALGAYVVYMVPGSVDDEQILQQPGYPEQEGEPQYDEESRIRYQVFPLISERGIEGIGGQVQLLSF